MGVYLPAGRQGSVGSMHEFRDFFGGLAQLARASGWQPEGQGFDSPNLHKNRVRVRALASILILFFQASLL